MMKSKLRIFSIVFAGLNLFSLSLFGGNDISIYDKNGNAKAYIADDLTIYLWGGDPVAYLYNSAGDWHIFGFNGRHLGWYDEGIIYDPNGYAIGAQKDAVIMITSIETIKGIKGIKPIKSIREIPPIKPILSMSWGNTPLIVFLKSGL